MRNKRRQNNQHISPSFEPNSKNTRNNGVVWLFIGMAFLVTLFFFGYQYYKRIEMSYQSYVEDSQWIEKTNNLSNNKPTTFLVVGLSFPDGGRIENQQATSWNLISLNPQNGQGLISYLDPEFEIDNRPLYQWDPRHETDLILKKIELLVNQNIDHLTVVYLSDAKALIERFPTISITAAKDHQLDSLKIEHNKITLLSSRQALQYMLNQQGESITERNQRVNEVLAGIWNEVYGLNHLTQWESYFQEAGAIVYSSLSWNDFLLLNFGSYNKAINNISALNVDQNNLEDLRHQMDEIVN